MSGAGAGGGVAGDAPLSRARWWILALCALAIFSSYYESDVIGPIADLLLRTRGFTQSQIGDLNAAMSLPNIPLALFSGQLIDRYGAGRVVLWAAVIGFLGAVMTAIGEPYALMWAGRFTFGSWRLWKKDDPLVESGLLGPVTLWPVDRMNLHK